MKRSFLWRFIQAATRPLAVLFFDLKTYGVKNVPRSGGVLLVANHQSYMDPVLLVMNLDRPVSFFARADLFEHPFLRWLIVSLHAFPVRKGEGDVGAMRETIRRLQAGQALNIYPEGSRTQTGEIGKMEKGMALIVRRAGVPIVPVVIDGTFQAWPKGRKYPRTYPIRIAFGPPLTVKGLNNQQIVDLMERTLRSMQADLRQKRRPLWPRIGCEEVY